MKSSALALFRGSLMQAHAVKTNATTALLNAVGIQEQEMETFCQDHWWSNTDAIQADITLSKVIALGFRLSGVPRLTLIAEQLAAAIVTFVQPVNWPAICSLGASGKDGTRLLLPDGDEMATQESISGERLYALVLAASDMKDTMYRVPPPNTIEPATSQAPGDATPGS